jgi:hypothetical protein
VDEAAERVRGLGRDADRSEWPERLARGGLVAYGVVHLVLGWLAVQLALGDSSGSASTSGAVEELSQQPFGSALVWAVAVGMLLLVVWQAIEAVAGHRDETDDKTRLRKRVTSAGKVVLYAVIGVSAVRAATGSGGSGGGEQQTDSMTAKVMDLPGGQVLVGLVAVGVLVVAGFLVHRGVTDGFLKKLDGGGRTGKDGTAYTWLGRVGYVAKGAALAVVGGLFAYAAVTHDSDEGGGLDQALTKVLEQPYGQVLVVAMGVGFACYGVFCFAWARHFDD